MFDDRCKASFDAAGEAVKQLLALATGSIGAAIALFDDGDSAGIDFGAAAGAVNIGLGLLAASVVFGLFALGTLAGQLGALAIETPSTYAGPVRLMHTLQMGLYGLGIIALVAAAIG